MSLARSAVPILDVLNAAERNLTPEEIFERTRKYYKAPEDLDTVYRDLFALEAKNCVEETPNGWRVTEYGRRLRNLQASIGFIKIKTKSGHFVRIY